MIRDYEEALNRALVQKQATLSFAARSRDKAALQSSIIWSLSHYLESEDLCKKATSPLYALRELVKVCASRGFHQTIKLPRTLPVCSPTKFATLVESIVGILEEFHVSAVVEDSSQEDSKVKKMLRGDESATFRSLYEVLVATLYTQVGLNHECFDDDAALNNVSVEQTVSENIKEVLFELGRVAGVGERMLFIWSDHRSHLIPEMPQEIMRSTLNFLRIREISHILLDALSKRQSQKTLSTLGLRGWLEISGWPLNLNGSPSFTSTAALGGHKLTEAPKIQKVRG